MLKLKLTKVSKTFRQISGREVQALDKVSFEIEEGQFVTVLGPSGSGKTTLLHILAGIESVSSGTVEIVGDAAKPRIGFVFQSNTIFPWRTVERNLSYSLEVRGVDSGTRYAEAARLCRLVGLEPSIFLNKYPKELSGGEARRVAIGMALAHEPHILLLDEPTSYLDYITKLHIQEVVQALWLNKRFTTVYVTHDVDEAILLGDRVLTLDKGMVKQFVEINLPRPRSTSVLSSYEFATYRDAVFDQYGLATEKQKQE